MARTRSPVYPNFSLRQAVQRAEKIFNADRRNPIDREVAAKHMGYSGLSGAADKALATMQHYKLLDRTGKGELRISQLAIDILHPNSPDQRRRALAEAGFSPSLFKALRARFPEGVSADSLKSYLVRENFLDRAIGPVTSAFTDTCAFLKQENAYESGGTGDSGGAESVLPKDDDDEEGAVTYGGARVGDLVQWESQGVLQFQTPKRVRHVSDDGQWLAVEGSTTGIPMNQVTVEPAATPPPAFPLDDTPPADQKPTPGEVEWLRNRLGGGTRVRLMVTGDMGPREITKLMKLLKAQRDVLLESDDDSDENDGSDLV